MIKFEISTEADLFLIDEWCAEEPYASRDVYNKAFLTGAEGSSLVFKLCDPDPVMFVRIENGATLIRMHIIFGSPESVSKMRIAKAILVGLPVIVQHFKDVGFTGLIFDSVSPDLIRFLGRLHFNPVEGTNDYLLKFEKTETADEGI